jgi:DNA-binding PadR family transcriptional regulator
MSYKFLILGLLAERPMSGYDIKKEVKRALNHITSASYGTLYPTLHKLLADGCVDVEEIPQRSRPSKKVYRITERGQLDLTAWLKQPAEADQVRREFLLKLYLAGSLSQQDVGGILARRRAEMETALQMLKASRNSSQSAHQRWVADYALCLCEAEAAWLAQVETQASVG